MDSLNFDKILSSGNNNNFVETKEFKKNIVLYGAGGNCTYFLRLLKSKGIEPIAICDSNKEKIGGCIEGFKVTSFEDIISRYQDFDVIITTHMYYSDVKEYLLKYIDKGRIKYSEEETNLIFNKYISNLQFRDFILNNKVEISYIYENLADEKSKETMENILMGRVSNEYEYFNKAYSPNQYFPKDIITLTEQECFLDAGAYTGDTLQEFIRLVSNRFTKVYCFEPFIKNFEKLQNLKKTSYKNDERILLFQNGLYDCNKVVGFNSFSDETAAKIDEYYTCVNNIEAVTIDDTINDNITFIKMDIEGSELAALKGARGTIFKNKPKLAICVYHKFDDMLTIPEYIMSLGLGYKYYLRHHFMEGITVPLGLTAYPYCETVFYAV